MAHPQTSYPFCVGVDVAGADLPEEVLFAAGEKMRGQGFSLRYYTTKPFSSSCVVCSEIVRMDENPACFRRKQDSTLVRALHDLADGAISALVTCANTGAVVSAAAVYLGRFTTRPALAALIPSRQGKVVLLDAGASLTATAEDLVAHAILGSALASARLHVALPKVGLLNIGKERKKGTEELKKADALLQKKNVPFFYVGFVEPFDVFSGEVDVLVTNGFIGNIFLKTTEGVITSLFEKTSSQEDGGALLVGVKCPLIKCHGKPTTDSFTRAIFQAYEFASLGLVQKLEGALSTHA